MSVGQAEFECAMAQLYDNSGWYSECDVVKAKAYITAAQQLMLFPEEGTHGGAGGESFRWPKTQVMALLEKAISLVESQGVSSGASPSGSKTYSRYFRE